MNPQPSPFPRTLRVGLSECAFDDASLRIGRQRFAYQDVIGFGVAILDPSVGAGGVRVRRAGLRRQLFLYVAFRKPSGGRSHTALVVGGDAGLSAEGRALVEALRHRLGDRWVGEASSLEIRKRLGISSAPVVIAVVGAMVLALIIAAVIVAYAVSGTGGGR